MEDRRLLYATLGGQWAFSQRITYSFVPDGTNIGGYSSNLFSTMTAQGLGSTWQQEIRKAAAVWQAVADLNLVQVSDNGAAFGTSGNQQNDSRFGDIRIGGAPLASGVLASTFLPPPFNGGTLAGDFVLSSQPTWRINSNYDLMTVAIHEFGHSLGMDHSAIQAAVMYAGYNGVKQTLISDDIQGIQSIYGTRSQDAFDTIAPNNSYLTATVLTSYVTSGQASIPNLDITTTADNDWYKVVVPTTTTINSTLTVTMQSSNLSSLAPKVVVYNASLQAVGDASAAFTYGATVSTTISGVAAGQTYYIRAMAANTGPGGNGAYGLQLNFTGRAMSPISPPDTTVLQQPNQGGGSINSLTIGTLTGAGDSLVVSNFGQRTTPPREFERLVDQALTEVTVPDAASNGLFDAVDLFVADAQRRGKKS